MTHYLQLEVVGGPFAGKSNILYFHLDENGDPDRGGSRDGTGQEGGEDPGGATGKGNSHGNDTAAEETGSGSSSGGGSSGGSDSGGRSRDSGARGGSGGATGAGRGDAAAPTLHGAAESTGKTARPQPVEKPAAVTLTPPQLSTLLEANPRQLTFHEDGMTVNVPSGLLAELALGQQTLSVSMGLDGADSFYVAVLSGDEVIPAFEGQGIRLWVPYAAEPEALEHLYTVGADGTRLPAVDYMDGRLLFHLTHSGSYTILDRRSTPQAVAVQAAADRQPPRREEPSPEPEHTARGGDFPGLPVAFALSAALAAGGVLLRRRGGKRDGGTASK